MDVAVAGKMIEQNSKFDEIPVDRALATVAQGIKINRIGQELKCDKQRNVECAVTSNANVDPSTSSILPRLCDAVVDQCSSGVLKGSTIETGQLQ